MFGETRTWSGFSTERDEPLVKIFVSENEDICSDMSRETRSIKNGEPIRRVCEVDEGV